MSFLLQRVACQCDIAGALLSFYTIPYPVHPTWNESNASLSPVKRHSVLWCPLLGSVYRFVAEQFGSKFSLPSHDSFFLDILCLSRQVATRCSFLTSWRHNGLQHKEKIKNGQISRDFAKINFTKLNFPPAISNFARNMIGKLCVFLVVCVRLSSSFQVLEEHLDVEKLSGRWFQVSPTTVHFNN